MAADSRAQVLFFLFLFSLSSAEAGDTIRLKNQTLKPEGFSLIQVPPGSRPGFGPLQADVRFSPTYKRIYYIVQFDGPVKVEWRANLEQNEVALNSYLPDDAFIAKIETTKAWLAVNRQPHVRSVVAYDPEFRVSQEFSVPSVFTQDNVEKIVVKVTNASEVTNFLNNAQASHTEFVLDSVTDKLVVLNTRRANVEALSAIEGVEWIEPVKTYKVFDFTPELKPGLTPEPLPPLPPIANFEGVTHSYADLTGYESGTKLMNFDGAYAKGYHGEGEVVGIADTGLDRGSTTDILDDLAGQVTKGYALGLFSKSWEDPDGHGTHASGSIVGSGASSKGKLHGGAYKASLIMQSMYSPLIDGLTVTPKLDQLMGRIRREDNVHIHSDSWGSVNHPGVYDTMASMVDDISWKNPDLLIIFAAGNEGVDLNGDGHIDEGSVSSPGTAKNCLTVGASKNLVLKGGLQAQLKQLRNGKKNWGAEPLYSSSLSENPNGMAMFSSIGPTSDKRLKPDVVAPGTNIVSTRSQMKGVSLMWGPYNDLYTYSGGTSMATPLVAGAAAVVRQALHDQGFADPTAALIKAVLLHTAHDLYPGQFPVGLGQEFKTPRPNVNEGYGRVDVDAGTSVTKDKLVDDDKGLKTGESRQFAFTVSAGDRVRATMAYTDAPASAGAAVDLVNDLDLQIVDDQGKIFYPNHLTHADNVNNTEMIEFTADHDGTYSLTVTARSVPQGRADGTQPYALVLP